MTDERTNRKMSAILSADVKGYSRLMSVDEEGTVKALNDCREIIAKCVKDHRGRVEDSPGDLLKRIFLMKLRTLSILFRQILDLARYG